MTKAEAKHLVTLMSEAGLPKAELAWLSWCVEHSGKGELTIRDYLTMLLERDDPHVRKCAKEGFRYIAKCDWYRTVDLKPLYRYWFLLALILINALILFVATTGCGAEPETEFHNQIKYQLHGVVVAANGEWYPPKATLAAATDVFVEVVAEELRVPEDELLELFGDLRGINFYDGLLTHHGSLAKGLYWYGIELVEVAYHRRCLLRSAYYHELVHHYQFLLDNRKGHDLPIWWDELLPLAEAEWARVSREDCLSDVQPLHSRDDDLRNVSTWNQ